MWLNQTLITYLFREFGSSVSEHLYRENFVVDMKPFLECENSQIKEDRSNIIALCSINICFFLWGGGRRCPI